MKLPFSTEQFLDVFVQYNTSVWPMQIVLNLLAAVCVVTVIGKVKITGRLITGFLALLWIWTGLAYHLLYFTSINKAAFLFGGLFVIQGLIFLFEGVIRDKVSFSFRFNTYGILGGFFILYALVLYPLLGHLLGHRYPANPTFGLPCPSTIFTFGILLWADVKLSTRLFVMPALWSLIGFGAALTLGIPEDTGLLIAGMLGTVLLCRKKS